MDQLFAFQIDAFSPRAQHGCELYANTMKRKALGSLFGAQICALRSKGVKKASSTLMFNKGFAKFATSRLPCRKSANLDNKQLLHIDFHVFEKRKIKNQFSKANRSSILIFDLNKIFCAKKSILDHKQLIQIEKYFSKSFCKIKINMELLFTFEMENIFPDKNYF